MVQVVCYRLVAATGCVDFIDDNVMFRGPGTHTSEDKIQYRDSKAD